MVPGKRQTCRLPAYGLIGNGPSAAIRRVFHSCAGNSAQHSSTAASICAVYTIQQSRRNPKNLACLGSCSTLLQNARLTRWRAALAEKGGKKALFAELEKISIVIDQVVDLLWAQQSHRRQPARLPEARTESRRRNGPSGPPGEGRTRKWPQTLPAVWMGDALPDAICGQGTGNTRHTEILTIMNNRIQCSKFSLVEASAPITP